MSLFIILFSAVFINNYVLTQFLGMCPFFGVSKRVESAAGMGVAVLFVMTLASAMTYVIYRYFLLPFDITYLMTMVFIMVIASIVQFVEMFVKKTSPALYVVLGVYLPLITANCAILGVTLLNVKNDFTFVEAMTNSVGAGAGFTLAMVLLAGIREKYENNSNIPELFRGFPFTLFAAGLMSIAFMGFQGLI